MFESLVDQQDVKNEKSKKIENGLISFWNSTCGLWSDSIDINDLIFHSTPRWSTHLPELFIIFDHLYLQDTSKCCDWSKIRKNSSCLICFKFSKQLFWSILIWFNRIYFWFIPSGALYWAPKVKNSENQKKKKIDEFAPNSQNIRWGNKFEISYTLHAYLQILCRRPKAEYIGLLKYFIRGRRPSSFS